MVVKKEDAKRREFKGVTFDVLAYTQKAMVTKMIYKKGDHVPFHSHPSEQYGYVVSGQYRIWIEDLDDTLSAGDSYAIAENTDSCSASIFLRCSTNRFHFFDTAILFD